MEALLSHISRINQAQAAAKLPKALALRSLHYWTQTNMHDKKEEPLHNTVPKTLRYCSVDCRRHYHILRFPAGCQLLFIHPGEWQQCSKTKFEVTGLLPLPVPNQLAAQSYVTVKRSQLSNTHEMMQSTRYMKQIIHSSSFASLVVKGVVYRC